MGKRKVRFVEDNEMSDKAALQFSKRKRPETGESSRDVADYADMNIMDDANSGQPPSEEEGGSKHTLESDEEEEDKYEKLDIEEIEGQEEATEEHDGETKITPFNMKDEMEEGDLDSTGNFVFKKKNEDIKDAWLDNIDWGKVKKDAGGLWKENSEENDEEEEEKKMTENCEKRVEVYGKVLETMNPGETVTKALKRLGGKRDVTEERKQRWKDKKAGLAIESEQEVNSANKQAVIEFTGLLDELVSDGDMEVYGYTFEKIKFEKEKRGKLLKFQAEKKSEAEQTTRDDDDNLDMFATKIDETKLTKQSTAATSSAAGKSEETQKEERSESDDTMWEFKWENIEGSELHGPCSSQQMQSWVDQGYFEQKEAWVRRIGEENEESTLFYSTRRIDFELYM